VLVLQESPTTQPAPSPGSGPSFHEELIIKEARRRQRRRRGLVAAGALVIALGATALAVRTGSHGTTPPSGGNSAFEGLIAPTTPAGAKQVSSRSIDGWTLRIYASSSGLALDKVQVNYELIDPRGSVQGGGGGTLGLALSSGVVLTGSSGGGQWTVNEFVVTNPDVEGTRLVAGGKILDSMVPVQYQNVRFVLLAIRGTPPTGALVQGRNGSGAVIATDRFSFPPRPASVTKGMGTIRAPAASGGGTFRNVDP
jgi:hypothetical protein